MTRDKTVCAVCEKPAVQKCGACKSVFYCSREHQKDHWKKHAANCVCYKLETNRVVGRHYVALRKIEAGEVVMREDEPLVKGPPQTTVPVCLNCYLPLNMKNFAPCTKCYWPLCKNCKTHGLECEFTDRYKPGGVSIMEFGIEHPTYKCVTVVRALALKDSNPELYAKYLNLESKTGEREPDYNEPRQVAKFIKRFFKLDDVFSEEEVMKVAGIIQINAHEVPITEPSHIAVYNLASYFEHSCIANCSKTFTETGGLIIRAATTIEKGEHLSICYTDPLWGTSNRRHHLMRTKYFECNCVRCYDPSELSTYFDAVRCTTRTYSKCSGHMLPRKFLVTNDPNETYDWYCNRCTSYTTSFCVDQMLEQIGRELAGMKKNDAAVCRKFLENHIDQLHENHYYMVDVKLVLAQLIGQQEGGLSAVDSEALSEKILLCKKLDELLTKIVPAETRLRGVVLFEMHAAVAEFGRRSDKSRLFDILSESRRLLSQAYNLLKHEPEILPEGKIAKTAETNLREMDVILKKLCEDMASPM